MLIKAAINLILFVCVGFTSDVKLPGAQIRLTRYGLRYGLTTAIPHIEKLITEEKIPNLSGKSSGMSYEIKNMKIPKFSVKYQEIWPEASKGLNLLIGGTQLSLTSDYSYKFLWRNSGSISMSAKDLKLYLLVNVEANAKGNPIFAVKECKCDSKDLQFWFTKRDFASFIKNILILIFRKSVIKSVHNSICSVMKKAVHKDGNEALARLNLTVPLGDKFMLDYSLTQNPKFSKSNLETYHKGQIYWKGKENEASLKPVGFSPSKLNCKMAYVWLSQYIGNTWAQSAFKNNYLQYYLTPCMLPRHLKEYLNTTCPAGGMCIGTYVPPVAIKYPNSFVTVDISAAQPPKISISPQGIIIEGSGSAKFYAFYNGKTNLMMDLEVSLKVKAKARLNKTVMFGEVDDLSMDFKLKKSTIGSIYDKLLKDLSGSAIKEYVKPGLNEFGATGITLPLTGPVELISPNITLINEGILVSSDIVYVSKT